MKFLYRLQQFLFSTRMRKSKPPIFQLQGTRIKNILIVAPKETLNEFIWLENFQLNTEVSLNFLSISNEKADNTSTENIQVTLNKASFGLDLFPRTSWLTQQTTVYDMIILNNKIGNPMVESVAISISASYRVSVFPTKFAHFYHVVLHSNTDSEKELILELKDLLLKTLPL